MTSSGIVVRRGALYGIATIAPLLTGVLVVPALTRVLGPREYGVVAMALVIVTLGMMVAGLGLPAAITRQGILAMSGVAGARRLVLAGSGVSLVIAAVATVGAVAGQALDGRAGVPLLVPVLACAAAGAFAVVTQAQAFFRVQDRVGAFVLVAFMAALVGPLLGLVGTWLRSPTASTYLAGILIGHLLAGLVGLTMVMRTHTGPSGPAGIGRALRIGLPTVPHQLALHLAAGALVLVVGSVEHAGAAAQLQLAILLGTAPGIVLGALNNAWAPLVYRTPAEERGRLLERTGQDLALLAALMAGSVALAAPWLLGVLAPASYDVVAVVPSVALVALGSMISVFYLAHVHLVFASGHSTGLAVLTPTAVVVGVLTGWVATHVAGPWAASLGFAVAHVILAVGTRALAQRVSEARWRASALLPALAVGAVLCMLGGAFPPAGGEAVVLRLGTLVILGSAGIPLARRLSQGHR